VNGGLQKNFFYALLLAGVILVLGVREPVFASRDPIAVRPALRAADSMNSDDMMNVLTRQRGALDSTAWNVARDPQRGPRVTPNAPAAEIWSPVGNGVSDPGVYALVRNNTELYIGGYFVYACGDVLSCSSGNVRVNNIAKWNGSNWVPLGFGLNGSVSALALIGNELYVSGAFTQICGNSNCNSGNTPVNYLAKWSLVSNSWSAVSNGTNASVVALAANGTDLYVGGAFSHVCGNAACNSGNLQVNGIAKWDGSNWSALNYGLSGSGVKAIAVNGSDVYVGGIFIQACGNAACNSGNLSVNRIAKWNGSAWSALAKGVDNSVYAIAVDGSDIYVGGGFTKACAVDLCGSGTQVNYIARWNGSSWSALGNGVGTLSLVQAITINGSDVYVGGDFDVVCGNLACDSGNVTVNNIARWDGANWHPLMYGVNRSPNALVHTGAELYAAGGFWALCGNAACDSGNTAVRKIARYGEPVCGAPAKPTLKSPVNNATTSKTRPTLKWNAANCADTYNVTVKDALTGKKVDSATGLTALQYRTKALTQGKAYKWFVQACNTHGCAKSGARTFRVQ
jgi:hypothetical protein